MKRNFIEYIKLNAHKRNNNFSKLFKYTFEKLFEDILRFGIIYINFLENEYLNNKKNNLIKQEKIKRENIYLFIEKHPFLMDRLFFNYYKRLIFNINYMVQNKSEIISFYENKLLLKIVMKKEIFTHLGKNIDDTLLSKSFIIIDCIDFLNHYIKNIKNSNKKESNRETTNTERTNINLNYLIIKNINETKKKEGIEIIKKNIKESLEYFFKINNETKQNRIKLKNSKLCLEYSSVMNLGNISESLESREHFLYIMSKIIQNLDELKKEKNHENTKIQKNIILFYYIMILLMPFLGGTASIAEMSLYSLWEYYLEKSLILNKNILLDVEALTLDFETFYKNFFEKDEFYEDYTPYYIEVKKSIKPNKINNINIYPQKQQHK
jgi:hypothetical protein